MGDNDEWKNMFQELTGYEKKNISLRINADCTGTYDV